MSAELVAFLRARLDEDEQVARRNIEGRGLSMSPDDPDSFCFPDYRTYSDDDTAAADEYIDRFNPARVLREITAKRQLLRRANGGVDYPHTHPGEDDADHLARHHDDGLLRLLALPYSDHRDYRVEWRP